MTSAVFQTTYRLWLGLALIGRFLHHTKSELPPTTNLALESRKTHHAALPPLCRPRTGSASNMDVGLVRSRIVATLDADADARRRAELDLKAVRTHPTPLPCHISLTLFSTRLRNTLVSQMHYSIFYKANRRPPSDCRVCFSPSTPPSTSFISPTRLLQQPANSH